MRPIVGSEDYYCIFVKPLFLKFRHYFSYVSIKSRYHSGELSVGVFHGIIA